MYIILSQKIDSESSYSHDEVFKLYHYPKQYRNQIHTGDVFVYYQGNRYDKSQRYYFGYGVIGAIEQEDDVNYIAELNDVIRFKNKVPIYLPDEGYIEQLGYETVRKSINPPWQSSIRPLSEEAYKYILEKSGAVTREELDENLKDAIRRYYIRNDKEALNDIVKAAQTLSKLP